MLAISCCLFMAVGAIAQVNETEMKEQSVADAKARTSQLTLDLGLTEEQAQKAQEIFMVAEISTLPERMQCKEMESRVENTYNNAYDEVAGMLSPEQAEKLARMRKEGAISTKCCDATTKSKTGCAPEGKAPKSGCCAGKASTGEAQPSLERGSDDSKTR
jgi:hypothetical protein